MRMGQGVRTGLGHGGITCVLQTQFSSFNLQLLLCPWAPTPTIQAPHTTAVGGEKSVKEIKFCQAP